MRIFIEEQIFAKSKCQKRGLCLTELCKGGDYCKVNARDSWLDINSRDTIKQIIYL